MCLFVLALLLAAPLRTAPARQLLTPQKSQPQPEIVVQAAARFRVTLNGFSVNNQSDDDILEGDGKGDEVYVRSDWWKLNKKGVVERRDITQTKILGDINNQSDPPRLQAGGAPDGHGGLVTGDKYPRPSNPWARAGVTYPDRLPTVLWEGQLMQGENMVVIVPTVWEWDNREKSNSEREWEQRINAAFAGRQASLVSSIASRDQKNYLNGFSDDERGFVYLGSSAGTRPIGMDAFARDGVSGSIKLAPQALTLTYDSALEATRTSPGNLAPGVFAIRYVDRQDKGDYTLYVQVELIN